MLVGVVVFLGLSLLCTIVAVAALSFSNRPSDAYWVSPQQERLGLLDRLETGDVVDA